MIPGVHLTDILTVSTILFFIGVYGFLTRRNVISMLISIELILNAAVVNFAAINLYLWPDLMQGAVLSLFIIAVAAAETALVIAIVVNLYRLLNSVEVEDLETMKH